MPDVAYNAGVGVAVYDTFGPDHGWVGIGGTSAGAPQWSALIAIADEGRALAGLATLNGASQTMAAIYSAPSSDFHQVGGATGLGSPVANLLIPYLVSYGTGTTPPGTTTTAPSAPANFTAQATSSSQVNLSWSLSTGATSYSVYELEGGRAVLLSTLGSSSTSYAVTGLTAGTTYSFEVAAANSAGSNITGWMQVTTPAASVTVSAPTGAKVTALSSSVAQVSWNASAGASGYRVYEWNGSQAVQVASVAAGTTSASISGQSPGATEYFYVTAYNATSSASTSWVSVTMPAAAAVAAPTNVTATATSTTTGALSWTASSGATGYSIYYWNGSQAVLLGSVSGSTTSVNITGMSAGSTYYFYVVATNGTSGAASGWVSLTTPPANFATAHDAIFGQANSQYRSWLF